MLIGDMVQTTEPSSDQTGDSTDIEEPEEPFDYDRYVKLADGKIVYVLTESELECVLGDSGSEPRDD